jgi:hypothetical protein
MHLRVLPSQFRQQPAKVMGRKAKPVVSRPHLAAAQRSECRRDHDANLGCCGLHCCFHRLIDSRHAVIFVKNRTNVALKLWLISLAGIQEHIAEAGEDQRDPDRGKSALSEDRRSKTDVRVANRPVTI